MNCTVETFELSSSVLIEKVRREFTDEKPLHERKRRVFWRDITVVTRILVALSLRT